MATTSSSGQSGPGPESPGKAGRLKRSLDRRRQRLDDEFEEKFSSQFAKHWDQVRADRKAESQARSRPEIHPGPSNFRRGQVPYGVDLAAAWAWRFVIIVIAGYFVAKAVGFLSLAILPVVIALFIAALVAPVVVLVSRWIPRGLASLLAVLGVVGAVALMLTFATQQVVNGSNDLANQVVDGLDQIRTWLQDGPLHATDKQINDAIQELQNLVTTGNAEVVKRLTEVGTAIGHIVAAFFIILFSTYFFLADGERIWAWVVRLFPRVARQRADASGRVAWLSLTQFVRATVLVATTDALGIMIVAAILKVPFVLAIGVLVLLGAFVPMIGATISGSVAVLVALVAQGPIVALLMLGGVIAVQQLEAHVLQPFLLGRMVRVHPLGVILAIAVGVLVAGIAGALVAVPLVASANAVVVYLSSTPAEREEELEELEEDDLAPDSA